MAANNNPTQERAAEAKKAVPSVTVSADGMRAELILSAPENGGADLTADEIRAALAGARVVYGIDASLIESIQKDPQYEKAYTIAEGLAAIDGNAATLEYHIELSKDMKPKENPDGSVDYKDLGFIHNVKENDLLCSKTPATAGSEGSNVLGVVLRPRPGADLALPAGRNTKVSEDGLQLLASCDGQVDMVGQRINILDLFTVNGDVGNATGNIDFVGSLVIHGNVLSGFSVKAEGNITIDGSVEDATVVAGGNIVIREGINGRGMGGSRVVQAGGYIKAKYIQDCNVKAVGDVETTFIQHSLIQSNNDVNVISARGRLTGGRVVARNNINAVNAGGRTSVIPTVLEVGNDPATVERFRFLENRVETLRNQRNSLLPAITTLESLEASGTLPDNRQEALNQARAAFASIQENLSGFEADMEALQKEMASLGYGTVNIKQSAYPGVRIVIGPHQLLLETQYDHTSFSRDDEGVTFGAYLG